MSSHASPPIRGVPLDEQTRIRLQAAIEREGVPAISRRYRVAPSALGRAVGGLAVLRGTGLAISAGLAEEQTQ